MRGIATGTSFRRLVAKTLARQFGPAVDATCSPFQFALSTRAGTDCVGHAVRFATDANPEATVLSIDGVGAYDHVYRSAMMEKLLEVPSLQGLLPFVRSTYLQPSSYKWVDSEGVRHDIQQHEGGEQGDPLMPLLFSLAIHDALPEIKENLEPGEHLFAFLDDVQLHAGKTRTWNRAGARPPNMDDLGPDVWTLEGIKILGTPMGNDAYVRAASTVRVEDESKLWERIGWVPDVQCAWQILLQCAGPRCHHWLRTVPPQQSAPYAASHDSGLWQAVATLLGRMPGNTTQQEMARDIATLPMRLGGLGFRSATRMAPAAFWAS